MFEVILSIERTQVWGNGAAPFRNGATTKVMSSERYTENGFGHNVSLDPDSFKEKIVKDKEEYEKYYAPREGYVACERCGKQVPINEAVKHKLFYIGLDRFTGRRRSLTRVGTFCSGECAMNEQMALE